MIQEENKTFKWFNCVNQSCHRHLAKILYPTGLIEIKFTHGKKNEFHIKIQGAAELTCPHCGRKNVISFINLPRLKAFDINKIKNRHEELSSLSSS